MTVAPNVMKCTWEFSTNVNVIAYEGWQPTQPPEYAPHCDWLQQSHYFPMHILYPNLLTSQLWVSRFNSVFLIVLCTINNTPKTICFHGKLISINFVHCVCVYARSRIICVTVKDVYISTIKIYGWIKSMNTKTVRANDLTMKLGKP